MLAGIDSKLELAEEKIRQFEKVALETIQIKPKEEKERNKKNKHQSLVKQSWGPLHICNQSLRKEWRQKKYLKKKWLKLSQNWRKYNKYKTFDESQAEHAKAHHTQSC